MRKNKKISILLVLALMMTVLAGAGTAGAAGVTYQTLTAPVISSDADSFQQLGKIKIIIEDVRMVEETGAWLTVELPSNCTYDGVTGGNASQAGLDISYTNLVEISSQKTADNWVEIKIEADPAVVLTGGKGDILLDFKSIKVRSGSGDIKVKFSGTGLFAQMEDASIASLGSKTGINITTGSVKNIGNMGGYIDSITVTESRARVLKEGDTVTFRLPAGFSWGNSDYIVAAGGWGFEGYHGMGNAGDFSFTTSGRELILSINNLPVNAGSAGKITIGTETLSSIYPLGGYPFIDVDDGTKFGDIEIRITVSNTDLTVNDVKAASYADYGITLQAVKEKEVMAGRTDQVIGTFEIAEEVRNSLKKGQTIYFSLPEGVKWVDYGTIDIDGSNIISEAGYNAVSGSDGRKIKNNFTAGSDQITSLTFKDMKVSIEPWFTGPLAVTVSGNADVGGEVSVAEVIKPVKITAEGIAKAAVGAMQQKAGNLIIAETEEGVIMSKAGHDQILITLPKGVSFAGKPVVKVAAGDLELGEVKLGSTSAATVDDALMIKINADSSIKSTIKITEIYLTLDRTVPEGDILAKVEGIKDLGWTQGSTALVDFVTDEPVGSAVIAATITPAVGGTASFQIGSKNFLVGGVSQVMDVAPYIKDDRSFVPVRYLGENMLGTTVDWNEGEQKVILKKGGVEVVLTIGSKTYTVNGEVRTADVAPEITDSRTFLPARYVAEAFGSLVGWDAAGYIVTIHR